MKTMFSSKPLNRCLGKLLPITVSLILLLFVSSVRAQMGTAASPFTSLGQAQNVTSEGVYYFNLSGNTFSTYVKTGGWVQVAIDFSGSTGGAMPQLTALNLTSRGILTPSLLSLLTSANKARIYVSTGQLDVQNTNATIMSRIVNNQALHKGGNDNGINNWTGTNTLSASFSAGGCNATTNNGLHQRVIHTACNGNGVHWIPLDNHHKISFNAGEISSGNYFQLLVQAPFVAVVNGPTITTQPSNVAQNICIGSSASTLSVNATSASTISYQWYSNTSASTSGGTIISGATSSTYTPPTNVSGVKYYYVVLTNTQGSTTSAVSGAITVSPLSVSGTASMNQTICSGTQPMALSLTGHTGSIQWQVSTDNISFNNISGATAATLTSAQMGVLTAARYYRAIVTSGTCSSVISNVITVDVTAVPVVSSITPGTICASGSALLGATSASGTLNWYATATGGTSLGTGTSFTTPNISATTTYYVDAGVGGCISARTAVVATVNLLPVPTISQTGCDPTFTLTAEANSGNALDLGTSNSSKYVTLPSTLNSVFSTNQITVEGWFYQTTSTVGNPMLIGEAFNGDGKVRFSIYLNGQTIRAGFYNGGWIQTSSTVNLALNTWTHIAATYDQTSIKLYINGVLNSSFNTTLALPTGTEVWYLGKRWDGNNQTFSGIMDEVRLWNVARTQAQIQGSMNSTVPVNSTGLKAYYKMDESSGSSATDATGNGYDGNLINSPSWQVPSSSPVSSGIAIASYVWSPNGETTNAITVNENGTYSVVVTDLNGCTSLPVSTVITLNTLDVSADQTICSGNQPANISISGYTGNIQWQVSSDNINFTNISGATSSPLTSAQMGALTSTRYYRAIVTSGACSAANSNVVTVTVTPLPTMTSTVPGSNCGTGTVLLGASAPGTINWYAALTGGSSLGTGTSYTTPSILTTTTYYVDVTANGCTSSPRTAVIATINALPMAAGNAPATVEYLVVGGGGGGGFDGAGGGGGGQVKTGTVSLSSGTYAVTIGNGGANATSVGSQAGDGGTTTLSFPTAITSIGGGGGGSKQANGRPGANGGGAGHHANTVRAGGTSTVGGFSGGNNGSNNASAGFGGGGGGGAAAAGNPGAAGNGGNGIANSISGTSVYYGGGGGGGSYNGSGTGLAGLGGAGRGGLGTVTMATAGTANTGGGGGGAGEAVNNPGKPGGSGVVIVKYAGPQNGSGGVITSVGGYTIHTFNSNGSFVYNGGSTSATVPNVSSCGASAVTFTGTVSAGLTLDWYDAATGGNLLSQGTTTYTTPVISTTTTYYVAVRNTTTGCVSATRLAVTATINSASTVTPNQTICMGATPASITLTSASGTIQWQSSTNNSTFTNIAGQTGSTLTGATMGALNSTMYYRAVITNGACVGNSPVHTVNVTTPTISASPVSTDLVWNGKVSNDWTNANNWWSYNGTTYGTAAAIPTSSTNVFIQGTSACVLNQPTIATAAGYSKNITIETGATLTMNTGSLTVSGNWTKNGSFVAGTGTVSINGTSAQTIAGNGTTTFNNLTINNTSTGVSLGSAVDVQATLTMTNGNIVTSSTNLLTLGIGSVGTLSWSAGTVVGPLRRYFSGTPNATQASGIFPVGLATINRYAQINFTSGLTTGGTITAEYKAGVCPVVYAGLPSTVNGQMIQNYENEGYWDITPSGGNLNSAFYTLVLRGNALSTVTSVPSMTSLRIIKSVSHTTWDNAGIGSHSAPAGGTNDFTIANSGMVGFSFFNIGSGNANPLPITLVDFSSYCIDSKTSIVSWTTASEQSSMSFQLERSRDLVHWSALSVLDAAGNSTVKKTYSFTDSDVLSGVSYYRLKQIDLNGSYEYYGPISLKCSNQSNSIYAFPNPNNGDFGVEIVCVEDVSLSTITLSDLSGKLIASKLVDLKAGSNLIAFEDIDLPAGTYLVSLMNSNTFNPIKVLVF